MVTTITPTIVTVNTQVALAPTPSTYQQSGAIVSAGGTSLTTGTYQYCSSLTSVTALLKAPVAITGLVWATGIVTATVAAVGLSAGETFLTTIVGVTPAAYNGTFVATVVSATTFTYAVAVNPGMETAVGTYTPPYVASITAQATTFFAQGGAVGVYVLELGAEVTSALAITALGVWDAANPNAFYAYQVPRSWDGAALGTLVATYTSPNAKKYFFVTTTSGTILDYGTSKSVIATVSSPTAASTEHQSSVAFYNWLANNPSIANPAAPMAFRFGYGVTPWSQVGNSTAINAVLTAYGNLILTGAEGGISTATLFKGTTMDGSQAMFWYAVDWFALQVKQQIANAIINASNNGSPIPYNQSGINTLLAIAQAICNSGISFGLALTATVSATPFSTYIAANPANFAAGIYGGFTLNVTPQLGFLSIIFNLDATQFAV